tara:strand:- start:217466 stop:217699 length:234 start_codon:yes stop_codon:yes gene_type:complete
MKKKNPLYVVKGQDVEAAEGFLDLLVKKFNLEPLLSVLKNLLEMLMEMVQSYAMFKVVKDFVDHIVKRLELFQKFSV